GPQHQQRADDERGPGGEALEQGPVDGDAVGLVVHQVRLRGWAGCASGVWMRAIAAGLTATIPENESGRADVLPVRLAKRSRPGTLREPAVPIRPGWREQTRHAVVPGHRAHQRKP